jgi:hypothetical protein
MTLDFLVIGAQKAGTTALHLLLRQHPELWLPAEKEAPFFNTDERWRQGFEAFLDEVFAGAPASSRKGKVTPHYMMGSRCAPVGVIAERAAATIPDVRLVALLRDPVERALSHWRMAVRRGQERRTFDEAVDHLLSEEALERSRTSPTETNSYLVQGEYGRILEIWLAHVDRSRLHVELTSDLEADPAGTAQRIHEFLDVEPVVPRAVGRVHVGGSRARVPEEAWRDLYALLDREVWPRTGAAVRRAFDYWFQQWNIVPDTDAPSVSPASRARLADLFGADALRLAALDVDVPWLRVRRAG